MSINDCIHKRKISKIYLMETLLPHLQMAQTIQTKEVKIHQNKQDIFELVHDHYQNSAP